MEFKTEKEWQQAAFNLSFRGLRHQGFKRSGRATGIDSFTCQYRGPGGKCCAVGWLIPNANFDVRFNNEGLSPEVLLAIMPALQPLSVGRRVFLFYLQRCHDEANFASEMEAKLRRYASELGLRIPDEPLDL